MYQNGYWPLLTSMSRRVSVIDRRGKLERVLFEREGIQAFVVDRGQEQKCLAYTDHG